jgi:hypothetical protein
MNDAVEVGNNTIRLDLTNYALKDNAATKIDIEDLKSKIANKLDKEGSHQHTIIDIKELTQALDTKLDNTKTYSYKTLINDIETIPYLQELKTPLLTIAKDKLDDSGYIVNVDATGDLLITLNSVVIASYNKSAGNWILNGVNLNTFIEETKATLKNHYDAITILMNHHETNT